MRNQQVRKSSAAKPVSPSDRPSAIATIQNPPLFRVVVLRAVPLRGRFPFPRACRDDVCEVCDAEKDAADGESTVEGIEEFCAGRGVRQKVRRARCDRVVSGCRKSSVFESLKFSRERAFDFETSFSRVEMYLISIAHMRDYAGSFKLVAHRDKGFSLRHAGGRKHKLNSPTFSFIATKTSHKTEDRSYSGDQTRASHRQQWVSGPYLAVNCNSTAAQPRHNST